MRLEVTGMSVMAHMSYRVCVCGMGMGMGMGMGIAAKLHDFYKCLR